MNAQESFASRTMEKFGRVGSPFRFLLAGGINAALSYLAYAILLSFLPYLAAYSIAYIFGIVISYLLTSKFVFNQKLQLSKAMQFPMVYVVQYLVGAFTVYLLVQILGISKLLAPILAVVATIPVTYLISRRIFVPRNSRP